MSAKILDGKTIAGEIRAEIAKKTARFREQTGVVPCLAAILVGEDPASQVYVRNKQKACDKAGIQSRLERLPADIDQDALLNRIGQLNEDSQVHGILVQLPLPDSIQEAAVLDAVAPHKDVDAFHPEKRRTSIPRTTTILAVHTPWNSTATAPLSNPHGRTTRRCTWTK